MVAGNTVVFPSVTRRPARRVRVMCFVGRELLSFSASSFLFVNELSPRRVGCFFGRGGSPSRFRRPVIRGPHPRPGGNSWKSPGPSGDLLRGRWSLQPALRNVCPMLMIDEHTASSGRLPSEAEVTTWLTMAPAIGIVVGCEGHIAYHGPRRRRRRRYTPEVAVTSRHGPAGGRRDGVRSSPLTPWIRSAILAGK